MRVYYILCADVLGVSPPEDLKTLPFFETSSRTLGELKEAFTKKKKGVTNEVFVFTDIGWEECDSTNASKSIPIVDDNTYPIILVRDESEKETVKLTRQSLGLGIICLVVGTGLGAIGAYLNC